MASPIKKMVISPEVTDAHKDEPIVMSPRIVLDFIAQAKQVHAEGLKSYGVFTAEAEGTEFRAAGVRFFDSAQNRRNVPENRAAFEAQGAYFRQHDDAGFVVDSKEMLAVEQDVAQAGQTIVAPFHSHRRQPPNFSDIDYRLHNPFFPWHLVVCMCDPAKPVIQPFRVEKDFDEFGIDADDNREGCENSYEGSNVRPVDLVIEGSEAELAQVRKELGLSVVRIL
ncbi:MAG: hypothetical protein R2911_00680 [Caldilineaceae bacterium]